MNILFCGSLDLSLKAENNNNIAANTTISFFKKSLENYGHKVFIFGMAKDFNFKNSYISEIGSNIIYKPFFKENGLLLIKLYIAIVRLLSAIYRVSFKIRK